LTDRELEVLERLSEGLSNKDIAARLHISTATVRSHVSHILSKLNVTNRTQAAIYAREQKLID
jgi:DNA-binding NarL/FixJ family response regulator